MNNEKNEVLEKAMSFQMDDVVQRYAQESDLPLEVARDHERELKRYLALYAINPDKTYGMRGQIDKLWHTFLMFTKEYAAFCDCVAGTFIHHVPNTSIPKIGTRKEYEQFLDDYEKIYGEPAPAELWPRINKTTDMVVDCYGCSGCGVCGGVSCAVN
ncbi:MAG: hypothetical protein KDI54_08915 [Gammaproteobacteria bacterium]|nr:hypothetical protein [Gammaproteobacteria bacterium]